MYKVAGTIATTLRAKPLLSPSFRTDGNVYRRKCPACRVHIDFILLKIKTTGILVRLRHFVTTETLFLCHFYPTGFVYGIAQASYTLASYFTPKPKRRNDGTAKRRKITPNPRLGNDGKSPQILKDGTAKSP